MGHERASSRSSLLAMQSVDDILGVLNDWSANKVPIDPASWLDASLKLMALIGNEQDNLYEIESAIAQFKASLMEEPGMTAAKAKIRAEASPQFLEAKKAQAKIQRVIEIIRISKIRSRMAGDEFRGN